MKNIGYEAIVLAGGLGTRLQSVVSDLPKPMADVSGRPFLVYVFDWLKKHMVSRVILAVSYKKESIIEYFGNYWNGIQINYSIEEQPRGTGGAIAQALEMCRGDYVLSCNGDTLFPVDLSAMRSNIQRQGTDMVMACRFVRDAYRYGLLEIVDNHVTSMKEKQKAPESYINGGVYLMRRNLLLPWENSCKFSFETEVLPPLILSNKVGALISDAYFIDIGIPEDYERARYEL